MFGIKELAQSAHRVSSFNYAGAKALSYCGPTSNDAWGLTLRHRRRELSRNSVSNLNQSC
jgi:hypothetical protein